MLRMMVSLYWWLGVIARMQGSLVGTTIQFGLPVVALSGKEPHSEIANQWRFGRDGSRVNTSGHDTANV